MTVVLNIVGSSLGPAIEQYFCKQIKLQ
jgi:hypothetical protein